MVLNQMNETIVRPVQNSWFIDPIPLSQTKYNLPRQKYMRQKYAGNTFTLLNNSTSCSTSSSWLFWLLGWIMRSSSHTSVHFTLLRREVQNRRFPFGGNRYCEMSRRGIVLWVACAWISTSPPIIPFEGGPELERTRYTLSAAAQKSGQNDRAAVPGGMSDMGQVY